MSEYEEKLEQEEELRKKEKLIIWNIEDFIDIEPLKNQQILRRAERAKSHRELDPKNE